MRKMMSKGDKGGKLARIHCFIYPPSCTDPPCGGKDLVGMIKLGGPSGAQKLSAWEWGVWWLDARGRASLKAVGMGEGSYVCSPD